LGSGSTLTKARNGANRGEEPQEGRRRPQGD